MSVSSLKPERIARYFSLEGAIAFLQTKKVHFTRLDKFSDLSEGFQNSFYGIDRAKHLFGMINSGYGHMPASYIEKVLKRRETDSRYREQVYASCWTACQHESVALWNLYTDRAKGIIFWADLDAILDGFKIPQIRHDFVTYRSYDVDLSDSSENEVVFTKSKHYDFEHEYRFVLDCNANKAPSECELTERGFLVPTTISLKNTAITLGFGFDSWTLKSIKDLIAATGYPAEQVNVSEINWYPDLEKKL